MLDSSATALSILGPRTFSGAHFVALVLADDVGPLRFLADTTSRAGFAVVAGHPDDPPRCRPAAIVLAASPNGPEQVTKLRDRFGPMPLVVYSQADSQGERMRYLRHGADEYEAAPLVEATFSSKLNHLVRRRRAEE